MKENGYLLVNEGQFPCLDTKVSLIDSNDREFVGMLINGVNAKEGIYWVEEVSPSNIEERLLAEAPVGWKHL